MWWIHFTETKRYCVCPVTFFEQHKNETDVQFALVTQLLMINYLLKYIKDVFEYEFVKHILLVINRFHRVARTNCIVRVGVFSRHKRWNSHYGLLWSLLCKLWLLSIFKWRFEAERWISILFVRESPPR